MMGRSVSHAGTSPGRLKREVIIARYSLSEPIRMPSSSSKNFNHSQPLDFDFTPKEAPVGENLLVNQSEGLGDILFLMSLVYKWINENGCRVVWPVNPQFLDIQRHFKEIIFLDCTQFHYNNSGPTIPEHQAGMKVINFRWAAQNLGCRLNDCMQSKYWWYGEDYNQFRNLWDCIADDPLAKWRELNQILKVPEEYNLVCNEFQSDRSGRLNIRIANGLPTIELRPIKGFTLIDWWNIIQSATYIHTVSTSNLYLLETMNLKAREIHLYPRLPFDENLDPVRALLSKNYILHEIKSC